MRLDDVFKSLKEQEEKRFTPERMKDAARLLRLAANVFALPKTKNLCLKYADMLDALAKHEQWKKETYEAETKRRDEQYKAFKEAWDSY